MNSSPRDPCRSASRLVMNAGQNIGTRQVAEGISIVSFMQYDLGFFDHETCRLEPADNPFEPKVSPMS